jgi:hypothetical protein
LFAQITLADIYAELSYYHDHREEIHRQMEEAEKLVERLKKDNPSRPPRTPGFPAPKTNRILPSQFLKAESSLLTTTISWFCTHTAFNMPGLPIAIKAAVRLARYFLRCCCFTNVLHRKTWRIDGVSVSIPRALPAGWVNGSPFSANDFADL